MGMRQAQWCDPTNEIGEAEYTCYQVDKCVFSDSYNTCGFDDFGLISLAVSMVVCGFLLAVARYFE